MKRTNNFLFDKVFGILVSYSKKIICAKHILFFYRPFFNYLFMRPIEDLINSGKTLTKKETLAVERYIQANSEQISLRELNDLKCISAIRKRWK